MSEPAPIDIPPSERITADGLAPTRRMDALSILYLVGLAILAGALIYMWRHPSLPRGMVQDSARVDTLQQDVATRQREGEALASRLAALEARPVSDPAALDARLAGLEQRPAAASLDLAPLEARLAALEARRPADLAPLEARLAAAEKKADDAAALAGKLDQLSRQSAALAPRLDAVEAQARQTASGLDAITERAGRAGRMQAAAAALEAGQRLGDIPGAPPALARFARDAPPTESALRLSFGAAAEAAQRASQPAIIEDRPLLDRMWTRAQQSVTVRQGDRVLVGDPIAGVIQHARQQLDAGDLGGAVRALDGLAGPARAAMSGWIGRAQSLLDARAAIAEQAARL